MYRTKFDRYHGLASRPARLIEAETVPEMLMSMTIDVICHVISHMRQTTLRDLHREDICRRPKVPLDANRPCRWSHIVPAAFSRQTATKPAVASTRRAPALAGVTGTSPPRRGRH